MEHIKKARKERDESVAKAERERREAIVSLDSKMQLNKAQATMPTSAPEQLVSKDESDDLEPPSELCCCITGDLMDDPVTAMDGHTYERTAIEAWFARFNESQRPTSPLTNEPLPSRRLIPSHNIRSQCKTWKEKLGITDEPEIADPIANLVGAGGGGDKVKQNTPNRSNPRPPENRTRSLEMSSNHSTGRLRQTAPPTSSLVRRSSATNRSNPQLREMNGGTSPTSRRSATTRTARRDSLGNRSNENARWGSDA